MTTTTCLSSDGDAMPPSRQSPAKRSPPDDASLSVWSCVWRALWPPRRIDHAPAPAREPPDKRQRQRRRQCIETPDACTMRRRAELLDEIEALGRCTRPRRRPTACPNCGLRNVDYVGSSHANEPSLYCSLDCKASFEYRALVQRIADRETAAVLDKAPSTTAPTAPTTFIALDWALDSVSPA